MPAFRITEEQYNTTIDYIAASTPCTISNENVPNYPSSSTRPFRHRNIDVLTLSQFFTVVDEKYQARSGEWTIEECFEPGMQEEYKSCKEFLKKKIQEAENHQDGVEGLVFSADEWKDLDMTYSCLFKAYAELCTDEEDIIIQVHDALRYHAYINGWTKAGDYWIDSDESDESESDESESEKAEREAEERENRERNRDRAEQLLTIFILNIIESPAIEYAPAIKYAPEFEYAPAIGYAPRDDGMNEIVPNAVYYEMIKEGKDATFMQLKAAAYALRVSRRPSDEPDYDTHASDRLKGTLDAALYLQDMLGSYSLLHWVSSN